MVWFAGANARILISWQEMCYRTRCSARSHLSDVAQCPHTAIAQGPRIALANAPETQYRHTVNPQCKRTRRCLWHADKRESMFERIIFQLHLYLTSGTCNAGEKAIFVSMNKKSANNGSMVMCLETRTAYTADRCTQWFKRGDNYLLYQAISDTK